MSYSQALQGRKQDSGRRGPSTKSVDKPLGDISDKDWPTLGPSPNNRHKPFKESTKEDPMDQLSAFTLDSQSQGHADKVAATAIAADKEPDSTNITTTSETSRIKRMSPIAESLPGSPSSLALAHASGPQLQPGQTESEKLLNSPPGNSPGTAKLKSISEPRTTTPGPAASPTLAAKPEKTSSSFRKRGKKNKSRRPQTPSGRENSAILPQAPNIALSSRHLIALPTSLNEAVSHPAAKILHMELEELNKKIQAVINGVEERQKVLDELDAARERAIKAHDEEGYPLWDTHIYFDVVVKCEGHTWNVHRQILCRESNWFSQRLPPKGDGSPVHFDCSGHNPQLLGSVLRFMYDKQYPEAFLNADGPLQGECIFRNVFMFIAGLSVDCGSLMRYAVDAIDNASEALAQIMPHEHQVVTEAFWKHLHPALTLLFDQGESPAIMPMRLAMCKLVDVTFAYLILNPAFQQHYKQTWTPYVFVTCKYDNAYFAAQGLLGPASQPLPPHQRPRRAREGSEGTEDQSVVRRGGTPAPRPGNAGSSAGQATAQKEAKGKEAA